MSQTAIGRAALILTTNASGMRTGLDGAQRDAFQWADSTSKGMQSRLGGAGGASGGGIFGAVGKGMGGIGRVAPIAGVAAAGIAALTVVTKEAAETLQDLGKQGAIAASLGLSSEQFTGIAGVAKSVGEDTREFLESLVTMGKLGTDAAAGTEQASAAFKALGLNANDFIKLRADEQFFQIFDSLSRVQDPLQRTRLLMQAFGEDGGKYLLPLLEKSPAELRQMASGFAVSSDEMQKARAASAAMQQANAALSRTWRSIAIAMAPVITTLANLVTSSLPTLKTVGVAVFRGIGTAGALAWDTIKSGVGVVSTVMGWLIEKGVNWISLFRQMVDLGKELPSYLRPAGFDRFADAVAAADDKVRGWGKDLKDWGKDAVTSWGKSAIDFNKWLDEMLVNKPAAAARAMGAAAADAAKSVALTKFDNPALLKGTSAEVSARIKHDFGLKTAQEKLLEEQKRGNGHLKDIKDGVKELAGKPAVELTPM